MSVTISVKDRQRPDSQHTVKSVAEREGYLFFLYPYPLYSPQYSVDANM